jgi:hypothetical protein
MGHPAVPARPSGRRPRRAQVVKPDTIRSRVTSATTVLGGDMRPYASEDHKAQLTARIRKQEHSTTFPDKERVNRLCR